MKRTLIIALTALLPLAASAQNRPRYAPPMPPQQAGNVIQDTTEYARVLDYKPLPGPDLARQVCTPVAAPQGPDHNATGAVIGGLTGALVGSRFGSGGIFRSDGISPR